MSKFFEQCKQAWVDYHVSVVSISGDTSFLALIDIYLAEIFTYCWIMQGKHTQSSRCSQSHGLSVTMMPTFCFYGCQLRVEHHGREEDQAGTHTPHHPGNTLCLCEGVYKHMQTHSRYMVGDASMILFMWWVCSLSHGIGDFLSFLGTWKLLWTKWVVLWAKSGQEALVCCEAVMACRTLIDVIHSGQSKE